MASVMWWSSNALACVALACSPAPVVPRPAPASHVAASPQVARDPNVVADLEALARRKDAAAVEACIEALGDSEPRQTMAAIALAEIGRPLAEAARPALLRALESAGASAAPQIAWALVVLGEPRAFEDAVSRLGSGQFLQVVGLDKKSIFDPRAFVALAASTTLDGPSRERYLYALAAGAGTRGLMLELAAVPETDAKAAWFRRKRIFQMIAVAADPRGGDALAAFIDAKPHIHFETRAALALAAIADLRALPALARRLRMDPLKVYSDEIDWEMTLKRDDNERVASARMIADLARLYPEQHALIREQTEDALLFWLADMPSLHANGMRALATMNSTKAVPLIRNAANPKILPMVDQQPPMPEEWVVAQSALRYAGVLKDNKSWPVFQRMLGLRPKGIDVTMEGIYKGGLAILGMSLRAAGVGAAHGLAEWGDPRAFRPLLDYIDEPLNNEQARMEACYALPWVVKNADFAEIARRALGYSKADSADEFRRSCLVNALTVRPATRVARDLLPLLKPGIPDPIRRDAARAIAKSGIDTALEGELFELMKDEDSMNVAALALMLGGSAEAAARAVGLYSQTTSADRAELADLWYQSFSMWTDEDLTSGVIFRYVDNADAILDISQSFAREMLIKQLDHLEYDNGPRTMTRVVFRSRLWRMARANDPARSAGAIRVLQLMKEAGTLLALSAEHGPTGELAHAALRELLGTPASMRRLPAFE